MIIDGRTLKRGVGEVLIVSTGEHAARMAVFAEKEDANVLDVDTMEGLGLEVEPVTEELRKVL